jgi:DNA polymerase I-like protein with 3'-5' exonuclease and polymerase domains
MTNLFPDLTKERVLALDIETYDPDLKAKGPGVRRDGYIIGVSVATPRGFKAYYPVAHSGGGNLPKEKVKAWLKQTFNRNVTVVGANLLYDLDYLSAQWGIYPQGLWYDVLNVEPLLNENIQGYYSLDSVAQRHLGTGKSNTSLLKLCEKLEVKPKDFRSILWQLSGDEVKEYAESDAELPLQVFKKQKKQLEAQSLTTVFQLETRLMPMLLYMRQLGVRINVDELEKIISKTTRQLKQLQNKLNKLSGMTVDVWANASVAKAMQKADIPYGTTAKGNPSFTKDWLEHHEDELPKTIRNLRKMHKFLHTFLYGQIHDQLINGRVHTLFNQLKSNEYGTVTGRFSSSHPNLQQIPSRDEILGPLCRSLFIPEEDCLWGKKDYSQIEFRLLAHYATGKGANRFRTAYNENPQIDFHQWCADESKLSRRDAKNLNFGVIYGIGIRKIAKSFGVPVEEAKSFIGRYHDTLPFVKTTARAIERRAITRGYVHTILGRRRRFEEWEANDWELARILPICKTRGEMASLVNAYLLENRDKAYRSGIRRARTFRALNAVIQGSAADTLKKAMVDTWESGIYSILYPHLTVHDELDDSVPETKEGKQAWEESINLMNNAISFRIPIITDAELLKNWGGK